MIDWHRKVLVLVVLLMAFASAHALPSAQITLKVVDENDQPVSGAKIGVGFHRPRDVGDGWGDNSYAKTSVTRRNGEAVISGDSLGYISYGASKDGYYASSYEYIFKKSEGLPLFRRWQPWNPTLKVVLKKKHNPTSLYVRDMSISGIGRNIRIPEKDHKFAYDLQVGDWVAPHGKGITSDLVFELTGKQEAPRVFDFSLALTFSNPGDGIQTVSAPVRLGSVLRLPHEAPLDGYQTSLIQRYASVYTRHTHRDFPEDRNYFFRVRTSFDEEGRVTGALYGKIHGNIQFNEVGEIGFIYYLNPRSNERGLEFDRINNLATGKRAEMPFPP